MPPEFPSRISDVLLPIASAWAMRGPALDPQLYPEEEFPVHCPRCGYELRGLPHPRCPECGTPFDRAALLAIEYLGAPVSLLMEGVWRGATACVLSVMAVLTVWAAIAGFMTLGGVVEPPGESFVLRLFAAVAVGYGLLTVAHLWLRSRSSKVSCADPEKRRRAMRLLLASRTADGNNA